MKLSYTFPESKRAFFPGDRFKSLVISRVMRLRLGRRKGIENVAPLDFVQKSLKILFARMLITQ
ncbi:MAG: hypothetical protein D6680_10165 [Cyanobacteria bacterium J007]|nr:MAG: hypothetical protein D6680_10165 [Cyanobacteria bacterium J007]